MKITLFMAVSVNGIIAGEDNNEDFLSHQNWLTFVDLAQKAGCMIWGRKTQEVVFSWGEEYQQGIKDVVKIVVSSNPNLDLPAGYITASSPQDALSKLESEGFSEVILSGGAKLNSSFIKDGLVHEIILNLDPVLVGKGIPLFAPEEFEVKLHLLKSRELASGIIQLRYEII